jgi:signal peptidase I
LGGIAVEESNLGGSENKRKKSPLGEAFESIVVAIVLAVLIRLFVVEPFYIPSGSMEPTLKEHDRIIVSKLNYHVQDPKRGDIIVFKYPVDPRRNFVKRLIATGGETVQVKNSQIYINGEPVAEDYLPRNLRFNNYGPVTVPEGQYFMMGDNRNNSDDSRVWGFLPKDLIVGKALVIYWPLPRIHLTN